MKDRYYTGSDGATQFRYRQGKAEGGDVHWMEKANENKGGLHRALGVSMGKKIPLAKIKKAEHSRSGHLRKQAFLADTDRKFRPK